MYTSTLKEDLNGENEVALIQKADPLAAYRFSAKRTIISASMLSHLKWVQILIKLDHILAKYMVDRDCPRQDSLFCVYVYLSLSLKLGKENSC